MQKTGLKEAIACRAARFLTQIANFKQKPAFSCRVPIYSRNRPENAGMLLRKTETSRNKRENKQ